MEKLARIAGEENEAKLFSALGKEAERYWKSTFLEPGTGRTVNAAVSYTHLKATDTFLTYQRKNGVLCLERRNPEKTPSCFLIREDSRGLSTIKCDVFLLSLIHI